MDTTDNACQRAAEIIDQADALVIGAGAGMGVDSGLPDFRGNEGFWKAYPALARAQLDFMDVACPRTFVNDPKLAWGFYGHRLNLYRNTVPHTGFDLLRSWVESKLLGGWIFTSNVDGQFQKAGFSESQILECHGSIHHLQCMGPCSQDTWPCEFNPTIDETHCHLTSMAPICPRCEGLARPNIFMFGDYTFTAARTNLQRHGQQKWLQSVADNLANVAIIELGAGTVVPSVRHFSHQLSREHGARIIRINPRESAVPSSRDVGISLGALDGLRRIDKFLNSPLA